MPSRPCICCGGTQDLEDTGLLGLDQEHRAIADMVVTVAVTVLVDAVGDGFEAIARLMSTCDCDCSVDARRIRLPTTSPSGTCAGSGTSAPSGAAAGVAGALARRTWMTSRKPAGPERRRRERIIQHGLRRAGGRPEAALSAGLQQRHRRRAGRARSARPQPPTWVLPMKICGTVRRPVRSISGLALGRVQIDADFSDLRHAALLQQGLARKAVGQNLGGVHLHGGHGQAPRVPPATEPRRQARPARVKACAFS